MFRWLKGIKVAAEYVETPGKVWKVATDCWGFVPKEVRSYCVAACTVGVGSAWAALAKVISPRMLWPVAAASAGWMLGVIVGLAVMRNRQKDGPHPFYTLNDIDDVIGSPEQRYNKAKHHLAILGNDCRYIAGSNMYRLEEPLKKGVHVRLLCVNPAAESAVDMLHAIDPQFKERDRASWENDSLSRSLHVIERDLLVLRRAYPNLQLRYLNELPANGLFLVDPNSEEGLVKIELYTRQPPNGETPIASRPHLPIRQSDTTWYRYFAMQFEYAWQKSVAPPTWPQEPPGPLRQWFSPAKARSS